MVLRNIVKIDEEKCDGCGICIKACAEGAIKLINGKAKLLSETYCDGLGACIGDCPQDAITVEQRECRAFDEKAVEVHLENQKEHEPAGRHSAGEGGFVCPGIAAKKFEIRESSGGDVASQLSHWPVQLRLISPQAPFLDNADLLVAADCVAFAMGDFHSRMLKGKSLVIACPKLDETGSYVDKLAEVFRTKSIKSLAVVHMQVPCCSGLLRIVDAAITAGGKNIGYDDITVSLEGDIISTKRVGR